MIVWILAAPAVAAGRPPWKDPAEAGKFSARGAGRAAPLEGVSVRRGPCGSIGCRSFRDEGSGVGST